MGLAAGFYIEQVARLLICISGGIAVYAQLKRSHARSTRPFTNVLQLDVNAGNISRVCLIPFIFLGFLQALDPYGLHGIYSREVAYFLFFYPGLACAWVGGLVTSFHYLDALTKVLKFESGDANYWEMFKKFKRGLKIVFAVCCGLELLSIVVMCIFMAVATSNEDPVLLGYSQYPYYGMSVFCVFIIFVSLEFNCFKLYHIIQRSINRRKTHKSADADQLRKASRRIVKSALLTFITQAFFMYIHVNHFRGREAVTIYPQCSDNHLADVSTTEMRVLTIMCSGFDDIKPSLLEYTFSAYGAAGTGAYISIVFVLYITWLRPKIKTGGEAGANRYTMATAGTLRGSARGSARTSRQATPKGTRLAPPPPMNSHITIISQKSISKQPGLIQSTTDTETTVTISSLPNVPFSTN